MTDQPTDTRDDDKGSMVLLAEMAMAIQAGDRLRAEEAVIEWAAPMHEKERRATAPSDVIDEWMAAGALIHEPTGIRALDELTGGGPVYGTRWYLSGAPDAGKTALLLMLAHVYALRGIPVGLLAVDEEPSDLMTRLAQRTGYSRANCEARDKHILTDMRSKLAQLPIRFYDDRWTIESAAADLARYAAAYSDGGPPKAMLGIDSIQTVRCDAEARAERKGREMAEVQSVTARARAVRTAADKYKLIALSTSELGRSAYRTNDPAQRSSIMASSKWSGSIEYSAKVLIGLRNVPGENDLIDLELAKNKHGPQARPEDPVTGHVFLRIDRRYQTLTETNYEPPSPEDRIEARLARRGETHAEECALVLKATPVAPGHASVAAIQATLEAWGRNVHDKKIKSMLEYLSSEAGGLRVHDLSDGSRGKPRQWVRTGGTHHE